MYGMRFAQIAQDMCNYLDAQTKDLAPNEALVAKKMIIRKLCRGEGLDDMIAPQSALSTKRKQPAGPNVARSVLITLDIGHCRLRCGLCAACAYSLPTGAACRVCSYPAGPVM